MKKLLIIIVLMFGLSSCVPISTPAEDITTDTSFLFYVDKNVLKRRRRKGRKKLSV